MRADFRKYPDEEPFFLALHRHVPRLDGVWHYHQQFELAYILRGQGVRYVGDSIEPFVQGDLSMVAAQVPHTYVSSSTVPDATSEFVVVHFTKEILAGGDLQHAALGDVNQLFSAAQHGVVFDETVRVEVAELLTQMPTQRPLQKLATFLQVLDVLSQASAAHRRILSVAGVSASHLRSEVPSAIETVCDHLTKHFRQAHSIADAARMAAMSESTFIRSFRKATGLTFVQYVTELRLRRALHLLVDTELSISEVAAASGFPNAAYFSRRFSEQRGVTPGAFRNQSRLAGRRRSSE